MKYEWVIVGGGVAGIVLSEILTREGHNVLLIEKNDKLASAATREFHEWIHMGSLYTLVPDKLMTLKFILGAIDDLLEYYASFERMNLLPTEAGLLIKNGMGWFEDNYIHFNYRIRGRKLVLPWMLIVARSIFLIDRIKKHDWLRRRAGVVDHFKIGRTSSIAKNFQSLLKSKNKFYKIETPDFTTNSRVLLRDIVTTAIKNNLEVSLSNPLLRIEGSGDTKVLVTGNGTIKADNVVLCSGREISKFVDAKVKTSYAPIAVVKGVPQEAKSFVELDYFTKNCINIVVKKNGFGLAGGISVNKESECGDYIDFVIKEHRKLNTDMEVMKTYIGYKNEITFENQPRNYLYHIIPHMEGVWFVIPGKFTLAFSIAPEFYRRVYGRNPRKVFQTYTDDGSYSDLVAETVWSDVANLK